MSEFPTNPDQPSNQLNLEGQNDYTLRYQLNERIKNNIFHLMSLINQSSNQSMDIDLVNSNFLSQLTDLTIDHLKILRQLEDTSNSYPQNNLGLIAKTFLELESSPLETIKLQTLSNNLKYFDLVLPNTSTVIGSVNNTQDHTETESRPKDNILRYSFLNVNQLNIKRNNSAFSNKIKVKYAIRNLHQMINAYNLNHRDVSSYIDDMVLVEFPDFRAITELNKLGWNVAYFPTSIRTDSERYPTTGTAFISRYPFPTNAEFFILPTPFGYRSLENFNSDRATININLSVYHKPFIDQNVIIGGFHESAANTTDVDSFGNCEQYGGEKVNFRLLNALLHALLKVDIEGQLSLNQDSNESGSVITLQDSNYYGFNSNNQGLENKVLIKGLPGLPLIWSIIVSAISRIKKEQNLNQKELLKVAETLNTFTNAKLYHNLSAKERYTFLVGAGLINKLMAYLLNMSLDNVISNNRNLKVSFTKPVNSKGKLVTDHKMIIIDKEMIKK